MQKFLFLIIVLNCLRFSVPRLCEPAAARDNGGDPVLPEPRYPPPSLQGIQVLE
jgi:hypothetical protein